MKPVVDISSELKFRTARSGGKGGQHVNKVETMVEGLFDVQNSVLLDERQKRLIVEKLAGRINDAGVLRVRSQEARTQLQNKSKVITKINTLINKALRVPKKRRPTHPSAASREERLRQKKIKGEKKRARSRGRHMDDYV